MKTRFLAACLGMLVTALFYLINFPRFGELPYNDYYQVIATITNDNGEFSRHPEDWLRLKSNEHSVLLPGLIYALNSRLFGGDNRGHSAFALVFLIATFSFIWFLLPQTWRRSSVTSWLTGLFLGSFVFTPVTSHNVVMGFSGIMWFLANAFATATFLIFYRFKKDSSPGLLWAIPGLGILAAFTYSTHLAIWPALAAGWLLLEQKRQRLPPLLVGAALAFAIYWVFLSPIGTAQRSSHLGDIPLFFLAYLGLLFSRDLAIARCMGAIALLIAIFLGWRVFRGSKAEKHASAPWVMLIVYGMVAGLGTSSARSGIAEMATSTRYATLPALVWLGLLIGLVVFWDRPGPSSSLRAITRFAIGAILVAIPSYFNGWQQLQHRLHRADLQPIAALALRLGVQDPESLAYISPWPRHVLAARRFLRAAHHVPFDQTEQANSQAKDLRRNILPAPLDSTKGRVMDFKSLPRGWIKVTGWTQNDVDEVIWLDSNEEVIGETANNLPKNNKQKVHTSQSRWLTYLHRPCGEQPLPSAYGRVGTTIRPLSISRKREIQLHRLMRQACSQGF